MSRGVICTARPYAVWLAATGAAAAAAASVPDAWRATASASAAERTVDLLVAGCATLLALSLGWLWLVTSVTVAELAAGRAPSAGGATRRLVLLACGAAVVAGTAVPAQAAGGDGAELLVGLPLPERAVAPAIATATRVSHPTTGEAYVVRPGDSLWSIARAHPAPDTGVEARWRAIWRLNHDVVGDDPDLIHPGQALRLTTTDPRADASTETDGER